MNQVGGLRAERGHFDLIAIALAAAAFILHAALANRYDIFRDELYFIACGRMPDFGYVDQPPLVPLLSAGLYALGAQLWLLRLPCVLMAALLPWLTVKLVRLFGGGDAAAWAAGIAALIAPMLMGLTSTFNTTVFEPVAWTAIGYFIARAVLVDDKRALLWAGVVAGVALEAKYAVVFWLAALVVGLAATSARRLFKARSLWLGAAIAALIAAPSLLWQAAHHWPFLEIADAAEAKNHHYSTSAFLLNQIFVMNPILAPLWIGGVTAPFLMEKVSAARFLSIAFLAAVTLTIFSQGKDYYLAAAYPSMFAVGAVAFEHVVRQAWLRTLYLALAAALSIALAPLALPILPPAQLTAYMDAIHLRPQSQERIIVTTDLPQIFADQLGWRDFVTQVGAAWMRIPPSDRANTAIKVDNYGEAAALDVLGAGAFPPVLSGHNQYFFWRLRGQQPINVLVVQNHIDRLRPYCDETIILGETHSPYAMEHENGMSIAFCRNVHPSLETLWPELKNFN